MYIQAARFITFNQDVRKQPLPGGVFANTRTVERARLLTWWLE